MTQAPDRRQDPLNRGGGWASSAPLYTWSSSHSRRRAPIYNRRYRYGPKAEYGAPRRQEKRQPHPGPWFQPPVPCWAGSSPWGCWGRPWRAPLGGFPQLPGRVQIIPVYGECPPCLCWCACWHAPWGRGWGRPPPGQRKFWSRRGRSPRRCSRRDPLRRPRRLYEWREPGMRAPHNTTQFIMNQIYEDMRQQEKQKRQQAALQAGARGQASPGAGSEIDAERWERSYGFAQNPNLAITPETKQENRSTPHRLVGGEQGEVKEEAQQQEECARKECEGKEAEREAESETGSEAGSEAGSEEDKETETEDEEGADEEQVAAGEEQKGLAEVGQREEENPLPLDIPLSFFVEAEETENFLNYAYLSPEQMIPEMLPEALLMFDDINF